MTQENHENLNEKHMKTLPSVVDTMKGQFSKLQQQVCAALMKAVQEEKEEAGKKLALKGELRTQVKKHNKILLVRKFTLKETACEDQIMPTINLDIS